MGVGQGGLGQATGAEHSGSQHRMPGAGWGQVSPHNKAGLHDFPMCWPEKSRVGSQESPGGSLPFSESVPHLEKKGLCLMIYLITLVK